MTKKPYSTPRIKTLDRQELFALAIETIEKITGFLDIGEHTCQSCGCTVWENRKHHQAWLELTGMKNKLQKWSELLPKE